MNQNESMIRFVEQDACYYPNRKRCLNVITIAGIVLGLYFIFKGGFDALTPVKISLYAVAVLFYIFYHKSPNALNYSRSFGVSGLCFGFLIALSAYRILPIHASNNISILLLFVVNQIWMILAYYGFTLSNIKHDRIGIRSPLSTIQIVVTYLPNICLLYLLYFHYGLDQSRDIYNGISAAAGNLMVTHYYASASIDLSKAYFIKKHSLTVKSYTS